MYCKHCGAEISVNASFCSKCGKKVNSNLSVIKNKIVESKNNTNRKLPVFLLVAIGILVLILTFCPLWRLKRWQQCIIWEEEIWVIQPCLLIL